MYLENFLNIWDDIYVDFDESLEDWAKKESNSTSISSYNKNVHDFKSKKEKYNFCKTMIDVVNGTRYNR